MSNNANTAHKQTRVRRSEEEWKALVSGFPESNMTLGQYCQSHGIAPAGFYKWRKRFDSESASSTPAFIEMLPPAECRQSPQAEDVWRLELQLDDGIVLRLR